MNTNIQNYVYMYFSRHCPPICLSKEVITIKCRRFLWMNVNRGSSSQRGLPCGNVLTCCHQAVIIGTRKISITLSMFVESWIWLMIVQYRISITAETKYVGVILRTGILRKRKILVINYVMHTTYYLVHT